MSIWCALLAGGLAGCTDCVVGMPADVVKSIIQTGASFVPLYRTVDNTVFVFACEFEFLIVRLLLLLKAFSTFVSSV